MTRMPDRERPSLLFIQSDRHNPLVTGCYSDPLVRTPTLDRLVANGVVFDNAYCCSLICVSSRMSMLTGRRPYQNEAWANEHVLDSGIPKEVKAKMAPKREDSGILRACARHTQPAELFR